MRKTYNDSILKNVLMKGKHTSTKKAQYQKSKKEIQKMVHAIFGACYAYHFPVTFVEPGAAYLEIKCLVHTS